MNTFIEKKLQRLLNHYIALDPESPKRLAALEGKVVTIMLDAFQLFVFQLKFTTNAIQFISGEPYKADTIIRGAPFSLLHLSLSPTHRKQFFAEDVSIEGDMELGQQTIALFDELTIDWEEYLSRWIGDAPAHGLGRFAKNLRQFSKKIRNTLLQNMNEYIHEEIPLFPPKEALNDFFNDVDTLRMDVDRLDAKINQLIQSRDTKEA